MPFTAEDVKAIAAYARAVTNSGREARVALLGAYLNLGGDELVAHVLAADAVDPLDYGDMMNTYDAFSTAVIERLREYEALCAEEAFAEQRRHEDAHRHFGGRL